ncbi:MAG TPA: DUF3488 and transglutaminase-like domain-containing protein [Lacunisphaera sp.]|nr:DUF3488 and transglutaminase-like domain-containing protein [Lacunisphaera sp.]
MDARSHQLSLDELRRLKWLLGGALAIVSVWTVFFLDIEALGLVGAACALILAALAWPQLPARVPALVWRLAVPAIIAAMALDFYFSPDTLPVLIRLGILLVLYRAVSYRRKREDLQLLVLGLFLIVVAGVLTVSLGFAFLLLLFTACALGFLFVVTLIDLTENTHTALTYEEMSQCPPWARGDWRRFFGRMRLVADWRLLGFAAGLFLVVVAFSAALFVVIPRFEVASGFFLDKYITRHSRTGFSDTVRFGDVTELIRDDSVAMRVDLTDAAGVREAPYWRLVVLDEYTPEGFRVSAGLKGELLRNQRLAQLFRGRAIGRPAAAVGGVWTFYVEPGVSRFLPLPGTYGILRMRDLVPVQMSVRQRIVALRTEPLSMTAFQLEEVELASRQTDASFPQQLAYAREHPLTEGQHFHYDPLVTLRGPAGPSNEAVLQRIVGEITGGAKLDADEFARRATEWLQKRHAYALSVRLPKGDGTDDIVRWLDSNEPGFCEYFAAGLAVLARSAGFPARVIAGYHGGVLNAFQNYFMVRNSDAHAWAEIYDGHSAWVRYDPTPGAVAGGPGATAQTQQVQDSSWSARFDSLRVLWYRRIVNFDSRTQVQMIEQVKSFTADSGAALRLWLEDASKRARAWLARPWSAARVGRAAGAVGAGLAALWAVVRLTRAGWERWLGWRRPQEYDPVRRRAGRYLAQVRPLPLAGDVVADLQRLRYGRRETWPEPAGVFRRARQARRRR